MVAIDTSVWIEFFKGKNPQLVENVNFLLDQEEVMLLSPVWIEVLSGASRQEVLTLKYVLSSLPMYYPQESTWDVMRGWIEISSQKGFRFGMADLLIAAVSKENDGFLWSLDKHFSQMEKLKFIKIYER